MLTPVHAHPTLGSPASTPEPTNERATPIPFAGNVGSLYELMPAERARRFANLRATLREANRANGRVRRPETEPGSITPAAARLRVATKYSERHVLAWYALRRVNEARAAREAVAHCQRALAAENQHARNSRADHRTIVTRPRPLGQERVVRN